MKQPRDQRGFASAQMLVLLALSLLFFAWFSNVLFLQYERAAGRAALGDATRQLARVGTPVGDCQAKISEVLTQIIPGRMGDYKNFQCTTTASAVSASVDYEQRGWFPGTNSKGTLRLTVQRRQVGQ